MLRPEYRDMMGVGSSFGAEQPAGDDATTLDHIAADVVLKYCDLRTTEVDAGAVRSCCVPRRGLDVTQRRVTQTSSEAWHPPGVERVAVAECLRSLSPTPFPHALNFTSRLT